MKQNTMNTKIKIISLALLLVISFGTPKKASAQWATFDLANTVQNTITAISTPISAMTDTLKSVNMAMQVIADAMRIVQMIKSGNFIRNLVLGAVGNETALLVTQPEQYIKQQGNKAIRLNLSYVNQAQGVYSNSIYKNITYDTRSKNDSQAALIQASRSNIPKTLQKTICDDDAVLTNIITERLGADASADDIQTEKSNLSDKICPPADPNDPAVSEVLLQLDKEQHVGGWSSWNQTVAGDNAYTKINQAAAIVNKEELDKTVAKAKDLLQGGGIMSKTECGPNDADLQEDEEGFTFCPPGKERIVNLGTQLQRSMGEAIGAPLKLLSDSFGSSGIFALIGNIVSLIGTAKTTMNAFESITNDGGRTVNPNGTYTYNPSTYQSPVIQGGGVAKKIIDTFKSLTDADANSLNQIRDLDNNYSQTVTKHLQTLQGGKDCYTNLITKYPGITIGSETIPSITISEKTKMDEALLFFTTEIDGGNTILATIQKDLQGIATMTNLIQEVTTKMNNAKYLEEMDDIEHYYRNTIETQHLPDIKVGTARAKERGDYEQKIKDQTAEPQTLTINGKDVVLQNKTGILKILSNQCSTLDTQEDAKRRNACNTIGGEWAQGVCTPGRSG